MEKLSDRPSPDAANGLVDFRSKRLVGTELLERWDRLAGWRTDLAQRLDHFPANFRIIGLQRLQQGRHRRSRCGSELPQYHNYRQAVTASHVFRSRQQGRHPAGADL